MSSAREAGEHGVRSRMSEDMAKAAKRRRISTLESRPDSPHALRAELEALPVLPVDSDAIDPTLARQHNKGFVLANTYLAMRNLEAANAAANAALLELLNA